MFSIDSQEFVVLLVVALVVVGPERLPEYAAQLAKLVRQVRDFAFSAREQVRSEMGSEFDDVDWQALDPRRYDPRRIVREALTDGGDDPFGVKEVQRLISDDAPNVPPAMRPAASPAANPAPAAAAPIGQVPASEPARSAFDFDAT